jgi:hypothetical protein
MPGLHTVACMLEIANCKTTDNPKREDTLMNISLGSLSLARQLARLSESGASYAAASMTSRGYGATAARLTPDQKVGSSNLSALISYHAKSTVDCGQQTARGT